MRSRTLFGLALWLMGCSSPNSPVPSKPGFHSGVYYLVSCTYNDTVSSPLGIPCQSPGGSARTIFDTSIVTFDDSGHMTRHDAIQFVTVTGSAIYVSGIIPESSSGTWTWSGTDVTVTWPGSSNTSTYHKRDGDTLVSSERVGWYFWYARQP